MLEGLFRKKIKGLTAIFDIKQGSVGGALVLFKAGEKPLIRYAHRISYRGNSGGSDDPAHLVKTLRHLAEKLCTHGLPKVLKEEPGCRGVDRVVAFVGVPWVNIKILEHPVVSEKPITITDRWLHSTLQNALSADKKEDELILEQSVVRAHLNGYRTNDPRNKSAKRINLSLFEAVINAGLAAKIQETLENSFHLNSVSLRSALLAAFTVVRDHYENEDNFLLVTVGSEVTEVALAREDALVAAEVLARGSHHLIEGAAAQLHTVPEEVPARLSIELQGTASVDAKQTQSTLAALEVDWQRSFDTILTKLKTVHGLPRTLFLGASHSVRPWFGKVLGSSASAVHTLTREPFRVIELDGEELLHHHHIHADVVPDSPLSLQTLFLHKLGGGGR